MSVTFNPRVLGYRVRWGDHYFVMADPHHPGGWNSTLVPLPPISRAAAVRLLKRCQAWASMRVLYDPSEFRLVRVVRRAR